jgi:hypothetical protein
MLELVELPKIPRLDGDKQIFKSTEDIPRVEEMVVKLVGLSKNRMIVGGKRFFRRTEMITQGTKDGTVGNKIFTRAEGIPRDKGVEVQLVVLAKVVGSKWRMIPRSRFEWDLDLAGDLE